jgi:hypothetical protein
VSDFWSFALTLKTKSSNLPVHCFTIDIIAVSTLLSRLRTFATGSSRKEQFVMASHFQEDFDTNKADDFGMESTTHVQPKATPRGTHGSENGLAAPEYVHHGVNPVLETEAQTKGKWFAYVKTKQFWLAMLLGQGKCHFLGTRTEKIKRPS